MVLMKCGHAAQGTTQRDGQTIPCCCTCDKPEAYIIDENEPNLEGRTARCSYGDTKQPSDLNLAFFEYRGPGSPRVGCVRCGKHKTAHDPKTLIRGAVLADHPFEEKTEGEPYDRYYCGCYGFD